MGARTIPVNVSFLQELLGAVAEQGRQLLPRSLGGSSPRASLRELAAALLSGRGEASGVAIASEILARYRALEAVERRAFLGYLATMQPDEEALAIATRFMDLHRIHWPKFTGECEVRRLEADAQQ